MDPASLIMAALAAGAGATGAGVAAGLTDTAQNAVVDLYGRLKDAVRRKATSVPGADRTLERHAENPTGYEAPLHDLLLDSGAAHDDAVLKLAEQLLEAATTPSTENTIYQARMDAKAEGNARVYQAGRDLHRPEGAYTTHAPDDTQQSVTSQTSPQPAPSSGASVVHMIASAHSGGTVIQSAGDLTVHEGHTVQVSPAGFLTPLPGSITEAIVDELLTAFQPPDLYAGLAERVRNRRWVSVTGSPGSGKSTLLASLTRPRLTLSDKVPDNYINAIIFCDSATTEEWLSTELRTQLTNSVPGYHESLRTVRSADLQAFDSRSGLDRAITLPLTHLLDTSTPDNPPATSDSPATGDPATAPDPAAATVNDLRTRPTPDTVRIVIDGLDQLRPGDAATIIPGLARLGRV